MTWDVQTITPINYDIEATEDDGSCIYVGCMDTEACNFNPQAMEDDGSCSYEFDCAGICGGSYVLDACNNCYDPTAIIELNPVTYSYTGLIEIYEVPNNVNSLYIEVYGAQGGASCTYSGGLGAMMTGEIEVIPGQELQILVGEQPDFVNNANGGGGGSFVVSSDNVPLIIAGGGSGATCSVEGNPGLITENGGDGDGCGQSGGTNGNGGNDSYNCGSGTGGGGGFYTDGGNDSSWGSQNGYAFLNGGSGGYSSGGGADGGFGGGGATYTNGSTGHYKNTGGGAGGGYSGGGAPYYSPSYSGGGGGSFNSGINQINEEGQNSGHGYVYIVPIGLTQPDCLYGCTDINAENYDEFATNDDESCIYIGCMDELACNFNPQASEDDGSCAYKIDCMGVCGGSFIEDACENCYDPDAIVELDQEIYNYSGSIETYIVPEKLHLYLLKFMVHKVEEVAVIKEVMVQ